MVKKGKTFGFIFLFMSLALAITSIALIGSHFNHTNMTWTEYGFAALGATELASSILVCVVVTFGFFTICTMKKSCLISFIVLDTLSALFILGISIFAFIGTKTRYWDEYVGCNAQYNGFLSIWNSIDNYLYSVDSILCSEICPCYINDINTKLYVSNSSTAPYFNQWIKYNITTLSTKFQNCNDTAIALARNEYYLTNAYFNHTFDADKFQKYYKYVEEHFKCTGFCGTTYYNGKSRTNGKIVKYLFSGIDKGIPEHFGCLGAILDWLNKTLNAWASVGLFIFIVEFAMLIVDICIVCDLNSDNNLGKLNIEDKGDKEHKEKNSKKSGKKDGLIKKDANKSNTNIVDIEEQNQIDNGEPSKLSGMINTSYQPSPNQIKESNAAFRSSKQ